MKELHAALFVAPTGVGKTHLALNLLENEYRKHFDFIVQEKKPNANFIVSGLLPRDQETSSRRDKIKLVNQKLRKWCQSGKVKNVHYLKPDKDWTKPDGRLVERYYFTDFLHLVEEGYEKFAKSIYGSYCKSLTRKCCNNSTTKTQTNCDITTPNCHRTKTENTTHSYLNTNAHDTTYHNLTTDNDNTTHSNLTTNTDNTTHSTTNQTA